MSSLITVSAIQLPAAKAGETPAEIKEQNLRRIEDGLAVAGERKSDVTLLGEYSNVRHLPLEDGGAKEHADAVPGPVTERIARAARRHSMNVLAPLLGTCDGVLRNVTVIFDRSGTIVGNYYKAHLPLPEVQWGIVAGDDIPTFDLDFGRVGVMTCMDIEYPEHALVLMLRGAQIMFFPHVQSGWGEIDWEIRYRARAVDTGLYLVSACYGVEKGEAWRPGMMIGRSGVIAPDGTVIADAGRMAGVVTTHIDLACGRVSDFHFARLCQRTLAVMASRRPELYGDLVNPAHRDRAVAEAAAKGLGA